MQKALFILLASFTCSGVFGQQFEAKKMSPDSTNYKNVYVKLIKEDSLQSTFIIWVKKQVPPHYHSKHTEFVQVVSGKGIMTLNDSSFRIKKGYSILIPQAAIHSVITTSRKPLKVISIQSPNYDGDRVFVKPKQ